MGNTVAIVGRPNVGKSTFFNRLVGARKAIVDEVAGVTRDRHYGKSEWCGVEFSVIDTGGYVLGSEDVFEKEIRRQVEIALEEADVILFLVDVNEGLTTLDEQVAGFLRKYLNASPLNPLSTGKVEKGKGVVRGESKQILLVANKADTSDRENLSGEFYRLGMGDVYNISGMSGRGTGELLDRVVEYFKGKKPDDFSHLPKLAIVGRPNAGKSSLLNALLGEERTIVTSQAGTTRDSIHTHYKKYGHEFLLIDTAGIRKKQKFDDDVEFYSNLRAIRTIEESDVVLLMIDAERGMEAQDVNIFRLAEKNRKGIIILVNKWDRIEKKTETAKAYEQHVKEKCAPFKDVPVLFISALEKQRIMKVIEAAGKVYENKLRKITDEQLDEVMLPVIMANQPSSEKGRMVNIYRVAQLPARSPVFVFYTNNPKAIKESYSRFLENKLREKFDLSGVPLQLNFRKK